MEIHSKNCIYRIINCKYCNKSIRAFNSFKHEQIECKQIINCPKCFKKMERCYYNNFHSKCITECLENQVDYYKNICEEKLKKHIERIVDLKFEKIKNKRKHSTVVKVPKRKSNNIEEKKDSRAEADIKFLNKKKKRQSNNDD